MDLEELREALGLSVNRVKSGTVLRLKSSIYTYAAVYVNGRWFLTGTGRWFGGNEFTNEEFTNSVLNAVDSVEVATEWAEVA